MDRFELYREISDRKRNAEHMLPYNGGNGRIDRFLDLVRDGAFPKGGLIVDVGGSHGDLVELALREKLFDDGVVLDISDYAVDTARARHITAAQCDVDLHPMPIQPSEAQMVTALDVIEHLVDPENFAREAFRVLAPGGHVFINTPNIQFWRHLESLVVHGVFPHTSGDREVYHGGHLGFFTIDDMEKIFGAAGFKEMKTFPDSNFEESPPIWTQLYRPPKGSFISVRTRLCNPNILFSARKPL
jgi:2-polyprenyl-3-methyl-5-hydroxy-6-metoxy-1,4-benzoquinol methylase